MSSKSHATRLRILDAARRLFNERGTAAVSTNHIAAEAGLSPGNLYYHFADKHAIIRGLVTQYIGSYEDRWKPSQDGRENLAALRQNLAENIEIAWEYRFFNRELAALLRADPELRATYVETHRFRMAEWSAFAEQLAEQGLLTPPRPPRTLADLTTAIWLISENWLTFLDIAGDPQDPAQVARQTDLVMIALDPYLSAKARRALKEPQP